jgi:hypothetical protein
MVNAVFAWRFFILNIDFMPLSLFFVVNTTDVNKSI